MPKCKINRIVITLTLIIGLIQAYSSQGICQSPDYISLLQQKIISTFFYPKEALNQGWQGTATIHFTLLQDGRIKNIEVSESSGYPLLDAAALLTVKDASPFPPLQEGQTEQDFDVPIAYAITEQEEQVAETTETEYPQEQITPAQENSAPPPENSAPDVTAPVAEYAQAQEETIAELIASQETSPETDTHLPAGSPFDYFLELALKNNPSARVAREQIELAEIKIHQANRDLYPSLSGEWKSGRGETITDPFRNISYGLQAEQVIFDSSKAGYIAKREQVGREIAKKNYEQVKNDLAYKVYKAFYEYAGTRASYAYLEQARQEFEKDLALVNDQYNAGLATEIEHLTAQARFDRLLFLINTTESDMMLARLNFQQALNVKSVETYDEKVILDTEAVKEIPIDFEVALAKAKANRPELQAQKFSEESTRLAQRIADKENLPKISLVGSVGKSAEAFGDNKLTPALQYGIFGKLTWLFGGSTLETTLGHEKVNPQTVNDVSIRTNEDSISTKFALLNNLAYYSNRQEARVAHSQSLSQLNDAQQRTIQEVTDAFESYNKSLQEIKWTVNTVAYKEKELKVLQLRRDLNDLQTSDVMSAKLELVENRSTYYQAVARYYLSLAALNRAIGVKDFYK